MPETVDRGNLRFLEDQFRRGKLPEQRTAPRHLQCDACKGKGYKIIQNSREKCLPCRGRGVVFDPS
jgi:DnaJ-class molecular chaperone